MNLINRLVRRAELDAAAEERAIRESELRDAERTVITVRRLPGAICWDLLVNDEKVVSSPNLDLDSVIDQVRKAGGRAVVEYDDRDSLSERMKRKQEGRVVVAGLLPGMTVAARWIEELRLFMPCDRNSRDARSFRVDGIRHDSETGRYVLSSGTHVTVPLDAHAVVDLAQSDA